MACRILVVDDQKEYTWLYGEYFSDHGYEVELADSGTKALECFRKHQPDLMIADVVMPGMDGVELLGKVRGLSPEIPVILMTGFATRELEDKASGYENLGFLKKPFRLQDIHDCVKKMLGANAKKNSNAPPQMDWMDADMSLPGGGDSFREKLENTREAGGIHRYVKALLDRCAILTSENPGMNFMFGCGEAEGRLWFRLRNMGKPGDKESPVFYEMLLFERRSDCMLEDGDGWLYFRTAR